MLFGGDPTDAVRPGMGRGRRRGGDRRAPRRAPTSTRASTRSRCSSAPGWPSPTPTPDVCCATRRSQSPVDASGEDDRIERRRRPPRALRPAAHAAARPSRSLDLEKTRRVKLTLGAGVATLIFRPARPLRPERGTWSSQRRHRPPADDAQRKCLLGTAHGPNLFRIDSLASLPAPATPDLVRLPQSSLKTEERNDVRVRAIASAISVGVIAQSNLHLSSLSSNLVYPRPRTTRNRCQQVEASQAEAGSQLIESTTTVVRPRSVARS